MLIRATNANTGLPGFGGLLRAPEKSLIVTVVVTFFLVTIAAMSAYFFASRAMETAESIDKSQELLGYLQTSVSTMNDMQLQAETYVTRGFVGAESRYTSDRATLEQCIQHIKRIGDDEGWRRWHLTYLELVAQKFQKTLDAAVKEKHNGNEVNATDNLSKSQKLLEVMRGRLIIIDVEERELLKQRLTEYKNNTERTSITFLCLGGFIFLFVVPLTFLLQKYIYASKKALLVEQSVSREIVKHAPIGILQLDTEFRIQEVNGVFENFLVDVDFPAGTSIWELLPEMPKEKLIETVKSGRPAILKGLYFTRFGKHCGRKVYWDLAAWPIVEDSKVRSVIIMIEDISEKTILSHHKEVIQQTIAHDLKSPLIASNYIIQAVQKKLGSNANGASELMLRLKDSNENALSMVKNMLEIAKYREGKEILSMQPVQIVELIDEIIKKLAHRCQLNNVSIALVTNSDDIIVIADKSALSHLITNLLENSIKFSRSGSKVPIQVTKSETRVSIAVQNFGPSISEADKERLFTPYWQGELGQKSSGGTGIGLYLCKQITEALGGNISFQSEEGSGTTFTVSFPHLEEEDIDDDDVVVVVDTEQGQCQKTYEQIGSDSSG
jgi:signal transduction histidine kinase/CHASE3 domain sensor protein